MRSFGINNAAELLTGANVTLLCRHYYLFNKGESGQGNFIL